MSTEQKIRTLFETADKALLELQLALNSVNYSRWSAAHLLRIELGCIRTSVDYFLRSMQDPTVCFLCVINEPGQPGVATKLCSRHQRPVCAKHAHFCMEDGHEALPLKE